MSSSSTNKNTTAPTCRIHYPPQFQSIMDKLSNTLQELQTQQSETSSHQSDNSTTTLPFNQCSRDKLSDLLSLTRECLEYNFANYSVWAYRRDILHALVFEKSERTDENWLRPLVNELEWLANVIEENQKNYQVWFHRQQIVKWLQEESPEKNYATREIQFINAMLDVDAKNYHAWQHRQWLVRTFQLSKDDELADCERLLQEDVRNNSVWNHRFFVLKLNAEETSETCTAENMINNPEVRQKEIEFAFEKIHKTPSNESAWNYALGMANYQLQENSNDAKALLNLLEQKTQELRNRSPFNVFGCSTQLYILEHKEPLQVEHLDAAAKLCDTLVSSDSIRKSYWNYRKEQILGWKERILGLNSEQ